MTTARSPVKTRSQAETSAPVEDALGAVLLQLQQLREERRQEGQEQQRFREEMEARFQERDATLNRLEQRLIQLNPTDNTCLNENARGALRESCAGARASGDGRVVSVLKIKPDIFDGTAPLREFLSQFSLISNANQWTETEKAVMLASCLRGKARSLLDSCDDENNTLTYADLKLKLELRFGEGELSQNFYSQFTNRKQSPGEDFASLGTDLERLARKAYPECSFEVREKIACSQFIVALSDGFVKRTLQMEGINSLRIAIERAKTLKFINRSSFPEKKERASNFHDNQRFQEISKQGQGFNKNRKIFTKRKGEEERKVKECWQCGAVGHFRSECPTLEKTEN